MKTIVLAVVLALVGTGAFARGHGGGHGGRVSYGGGHHTGSHGGTYLGGLGGSSHRGGHYSQIYTLRTCTMIWYMIPSATTSPRGLWEMCECTLLITFCGCWRELGAS